MTSIASHGLDLVCLDSVGLILDLLGLVRLHLVLLAILVSSDLLGLAQFYLILVSFLGWAYRLWFELVPFNWIGFGLVCLELLPINLFSFGSIWLILNGSGSCWSLYFSLDGSDFFDIIFGYICCVLVLIWDKLA